MGTIYSKPVEHLIINDYDTFTPMLTWNRSLASPPETFYFQEVILQSMIRQWLSDHTNLQFMLNSMDLPHLQAQDFEVLGEKALPEGHIDILIKDRIPTGYSRKVIIEIKLGQAQLKHVLQLKNYIDEIGQECLVGTLIARGFPKKVQMEAENNRVECLTYSFGQVNMTRKYSFAELRSNLTISLPKEHKL